MRSSLLSRGVSLFHLRGLAGAQELGRAALITFGAVDSSSTALSVRQHSNATAGSSASLSWEQLHRDGVPVNPCQSPHHPAVAEGVVQLQGEELSVQEAYNPESQCFGCGPEHPDGLRLQSFRMPGEGLGRLEAQLSFPSRYCAFPGVVNGGIVSTVMDCHGNWAAAVALMDKGCLPRPPLTLTASMAVTYKEPTPPSTPLVLRSRVLSIKDSAAPGQKAQKATVEVEVVLLQPTGWGGAHGYSNAGAGAGVDPQGSETAAAAAGGGGGDGAGSDMKILAVGRGVFKRLGALRAL